MKVRWEIEYDSKECGEAGEYLNRLFNDKFEYTGYNTWDGDTTVPKVFLRSLKKGEYKGQ